MDSDTYCVNEPSVISEVVDGETIILNFESGHYYSFNATASGIWMRVRAGDPVTAVTEWVARRFGVDPATIHNEVKAFETLEKILLGAVTDMEELLLLDPIHEVGNAGWPQKP